MLTVYLLQYYRLTSVCETCAQFVLFSAILYHQKPSLVVLFDVFCAVKEYLLHPCFVHYDGAFMLCLNSIC